MISQRVDQAGGGDDGGAVLVVMEDRNVHQLAQALLDDEAVGRLDVLKIDAAEGGPEIAHRADELVDVLGVDFEIDRIDIGEALEQHRLAFHHRLRGERPEIAQAQNRRAVGDDRDEIALGGIVIGGVGIFGDLAHRHRDAGAIGERQVALRRHRLGRVDFELAGLAALVELQGFLFGEGRALAAAFCRCS